MAKLKRNKKTINGQQNPTHKTKDWATRTPQKKRGLIWYLTQHYDIHFVCGQ